MVATVTIYLGTGAKCSSGWVAPSTRADSTAYAQWAGVAPATPNGHHYIIVEAGHAGTSGGSDPFSAGDENWDTISDGAVTWTCFDEFTNPVHVTGKPFGHGFEGGLAYANHICTTHPLVIDTTGAGVSGAYFNSATDTFTLADLYSAHEVPFALGAVLSNGSLVDGRLYEYRADWKKGTTIIWKDWHQFNWDNTWWGYHPMHYIGWTPCMWWAGGSGFEADPTTLPEIKDNGTDYSLVIDLYDTVSGTVVATATKTFTITDLEHTTVSGGIQDYNGLDIDGDIGIKVVDGLDYYRRKNQDASYVIAADGLSGSVNVEVYRSGYVVLSESVTLVQRDMATLNFTGTKYLQATVEGVVHDADGLALPNANVFGARTGAVYGCKTASDGKYALPLHTGGTYTIKAIKNNHNLLTQAATVTQSGDHPSSMTTKSFTGANKLTRVSAYPVGIYAHLDSLASAVQSVIIPDDALTTNVPIIPTSVGATIVKLRNRAAAAGSTSMGTSDDVGTDGRGYGSGRCNYDGDMGDAEGWSNVPEQEDDPIPPPLYHTICANDREPWGNTFTYCSDAGISLEFNRGDKDLYIDMWLYPPAINQVKLAYWDYTTSAEYLYANWMIVGTQFIFNGVTYEISEITPTAVGTGGHCWIKFFAV